jgi:hypothetical protein
MFADTDLEIKDEQRRFIGGTQSLAATKRFHVSRLLNHPASLDN